MHGPNVRRMIPEPGDPNREVPVAKTFHEQTDEEFIKKEVKQMEGDDQAIQTILIGLPEYIYVVVDSCETDQEIWLRVQQMMKGSDIGIKRKRLDQPSQVTYMQQPLPNNNFIPQPSFNTNYMQQPMPNPEDITDPTTAMNMALVLMAKAFKLNYSTPTNNNQRISSNLQNRQISQPGMNLSQDRQMQMVGVQNVGNQNANQNGNGRFVSSTHADGKLKLQSSLRGVYGYAEIRSGHRQTYRRLADVSYYKQSTLSRTISTDKAPVYDSDGLAELSKEKSTVSFLHQEKKMLKSDFKIRKEELFDKQIQFEQKIKELDNILVKTCQSIQTMHMLSPKPDSFYHTEQKMDLGYQNPFYLKQSQQKQQSLYNGKVLLEKHDLPIVYDSEETLQLAQESRLKMKQLNKEIKPANYSKINQPSKVFVSQRAKSREELYFSNTSKMANVSKSISMPNEEFSDDTSPTLLFDKVSKQKDTTKGTSVNTKFVNQSTVGKPLLQPLRNHYVVRQPNAFQSERPKFSKTRVPPKVVETNDLSNRVTSVPITKEATVVKNDKVIAPRMYRINPFKTSREYKFMPINQARASARTKPITVSQPHVITKKDVNSNTNGLPSTGVESTAKKPKPQPRSNTKNNRNDKSEVVCAMCKQCLITANHDVCVLKYVNDMNSCGDKHSANVSKIANQKKHKPKVKKPKKLGSKERLASPKPSKPRSCLRWSPTRIFDLKGKIIASSESECQSDSSKCDIMYFKLSRTTLKDLEVAFRRNTCFVRNLEGVDLLKGNHTTNLYIINLHEMASASSICLMAHATSTKSWLWHQLLSYLNFNTINDIAKNDLVIGLP
ncbi:hypothetical protein Tco_1563461 [Tanacetum coccineum]